MSFQRPHEPLAPSPENADQYNADELTLPDSARDGFERQFAGKPEYQRAYVNGGVEAQGGPYRPHDEADLKRQLAHYYALISTIDAQIGRVFDWLRQNGEWENTIICYHADHGDFAGQHGLMLKNLGIYESIHRIPFLWKWPDCPAGQTIDGLVESVDLAPTFCDLAGLSVPTDFEGRSLRAVVNGEAAPLEVTVCEYDHGGPNRSFLGARDARYRLVWSMEHPDDGELYDHESDAGELDNLWHSPAHFGIRAALTAQLLNHAARWKRVGSSRQGGGPGLAELVHSRAVKWSALSSLWE